MVAAPAMASLWWALAFLPSARVGPPTVERWPPTLPVLVTDLGVAVFGPLGAAFVVIALVRGPGLAVASVAGLAIGAVAIRSLWGFGFLGLLAVLPVVSLIGEVLFSPMTDNRWLIRPALAVLLVMIAWRRFRRVGTAT